MAIRRYEAVLWVPRCGAWHPHTVGRYRTRGRAHARVVSVLESHVTTVTRARGERFPYYGDVRDSRDWALCGETIDAPVRIVPSVGELGWTP
jgi:hypothetical protein